MYLRSLFFILLGTSLIGCLPNTPRSEPPNVKVEFTPLEIIPQASLSVLSEDVYAKDTLLKKHFTNQVLHTANYLGLIPALKSLVAASKDEREDKIQELNNNVSTIFMEISTTSAELDYEEERADQIADYLLDVSSTHNNMLTLYSIILAALGTIVVSLLDLFFKTKKLIYSSVQILLGIIVAIISISILSAQEIQISFTHERNLLGEAGSGNSSNHFYPEVWNYLNKSELGEKEKPPLRQLLLERWITTGELGAKSEEDKARLLNLLFGNGGIYKASELRIRANYLDQLESLVNLMKNDVLKLHLQLNKISADL